MGSSIEAAITISAVILILSAFIIYPVYSLHESIDDVNDGILELSEDTSVESFCTFMTGVSENYRILIGGY